MEKSYWLWFCNQRTKLNIDVAKSSIYYCNHLWSQIMVGKKVLTHWVLRGHCHSIINVQHKEIGYYLIAFPYWHTLPSHSQNISDHILQFQAHLQFSYVKVLVLIYFSNKSLFVDIFICILLDHTNSHFFTVLFLSCKRTFHIYHSFHKESQNFLFFH